MVIPTPAILARSLRIRAPSIATASTSTFASVAWRTIATPQTASSTPFPPLLPSSSTFRTPFPARQRRSLHSSPPRRVKVDEAQYGQIAKIAEARANERTELLASVSDTDTQSEAIKKAKRIRVLEPVGELWTEYQGLQEAYAESLPLLEDADPSMREMAASEIADLRTSIGTLLSTTLPTMLLPPSSQSELSCIIELKAGQGGDEAAIFTAEMVHMYQAYARSRRWKVAVLEEVPMTTAGTDGIKEAKLEIKGAGAYGRLRWESGVHRVQRVPATEKAGRTHTSTMAVIVNPIFENTDTEDLSYVSEGDVKTDFMRSSGAGGQKVNKTESAVRLTHIPTGIVSACQEGRSQHANRELAWTVLRARVYAHRNAIVEAAAREARQSQIPGMDRSDKIRTWNFPQDRVTDHRVPVTMSNVPGIMSGAGLDDLLDAVAEYRLNLRLTAMLEGDVVDLDG